jgi:hypothetical protein
MSELTATAPMESDDMRPEERFGYVETMPEEIRNLFLELCAIVVDIHLRWEFLSGLTKDRMNAYLFKDAIPTSYNVISSSVADTIIMSICRLAVGSGYRGQLHLTLKSFTKKCCSIPELKGLQLKRLQQKFETACDPFREQRNRRIGHNDLATVMRQHKQPLLNVSIPEVDSVLRIASEILKAVYSHYAKAEIAIDPPHHVGGADTFVDLLRKGYEANQPRFPLSSQIPPELLPP